MILSRRSQSIIVKSSLEIAKTKEFPNHAHQFRIVQILKIHPNFKIKLVQLEVEVLLNNNQHSNHTIESKASTNRKRHHRERIQSTETISTTMQVVHL